MNKEMIPYMLLGAVVGVIGTIMVTQSSPNNNHSATMDHEEMSMGDMSSSLHDKRGDEFDKAFIEMMIDHHQGAIDMAELIPGRSKHEEIEKLGRAIITTQTTEINDMRNWAKAWGYVK